MRGEGTSYDWFFLAMAHACLGDYDRARTSFCEAVDWMDGYMPHDRDLQRFRREATAVLDGRQVWEH